jgi:hypothetical protein
MACLLSIQPCAPNRVFQPEYPDPRWHYHLKEIAMTTRVKPKRAKAAKKASRAKPKLVGRTTRSPAKRANRSRRPKRPKKANGRGKTPVKRGRKAASRAAKSHARAADVKPADSNAIDRPQSASGRMHAVTTTARELTTPKPRPAGPTRQQRKKATNEQGFGFKQIEERYTARGKTGIAAERRETVREVDEELETEGVGQGQPAAGFVDYDKQEHTPDKAEEEGEERVDVVAPAEEE